MPAAQVVHLASVKLALHAQSPAEVQPPPPASPTPQPQGWQPEPKNPERQVSQVDPVNPGRQEHVPVEEQLVPFDPGEEQAQAWQVAPER